MNRRDIYLQVVPPIQAEMMFNAVKAKGIPCAFILYKGWSLNSNIHNNFL